MVMYSSVADVQTDLMRPLTDAEAAKATRLLEYAAALLKQQVPRLDERLAAGSLSADAVAAVSTAMVTRVMRNPDGRRTNEVRVDDAARSWTIDQALSSGALYVSEFELGTLRPPVAGPWAGSLSYDRSR